MSLSDYNKLEIDNLPNRLTLFRILLVPFVIGSLSLCLFQETWVRDYQTTLEWIAGITFTIAAITDFIDGYIARKRNIVTVFGSFLDPIADKFLTVSALIMLQALNRVHAIIVIILVLREIYITSLRLLASAEGLSVPVNSIGKWKTVTQMIGIPLLMISTDPWGIPFLFLGKIFIYLASFLSLYSSVVYSIGLMRKVNLMKMQHKESKKNQTII
ncbi:MAG: CDP-diacylglycerol--glycerol-3-phosphate 3-phosphatidyltransferase [Oligoflexia bacterium]|nr:CDP-diacylglycerol--glycerol-3-phosphate 3-phosphatidyltransferase [Oligoflexia bacterium]